MTTTLKNANKMARTPPEAIVSVNTHGLYGAVPPQLSGQVYTTNTTAGQSGSIFVSQDGTGSRTLAYGTNWDFAGGTAPTLSTAASAIDRIDYVVRTATSIHAVFTANYS